MDTVTSLTGNGLKDWLLQRLSAVVLAAYTIFFAGFLTCHPHATYSVWHHLFSNPFMQVATVVVLVSFLVHAWIGMWTVATDYITCQCLRLAFFGALALGLLTLFVWALIILF